MDWLTWQQGAAIAASNSPRAIASAAAAVEAVEINSASG
jgi:hypothetical protein